MEHEENVFVCGSIHSLSTWNGEVQSNKDATCDILRAATVCEEWLKGKNDLIEERVQCGAQDLKVHEAGEQLFRSILEEEVIHADVL